MVGYAKAMIVIGAMLNNNVSNTQEAAAVASNMAAWAQDAADQLDDPEVKDFVARKIL